MVENLRCEDCGKWFESAGALRLHRYADHGVTVRGTAGRADAIPEPVSPRVAAQQEDPAEAPGRRDLPNPRRRLVIGAAVVVVAIGAVVGALWATGYIGSEERPEPIVLPECTEPDVAQIDQLSQEWNARTATYNEQRNAALGANDTERVQELDDRRLQETSIYESAMLSLLSCQDATWDFEAE